MEFNIESIVRENIRHMTPYSAARHEFSGTASVFMDANENAMGSPVSLNEQPGTGPALNRYPDPLQWKLKEKLSLIKGVPPQHIFLGNGSDEAIDLLLRIFCNPGLDNIIVLPPTYGMYEVCAAMNDVKVKKVPLLETFQPDLEAIAKAIDSHTRIIFVCSPNNPTGNSINRSDIELLLNNFNGLIVVDEAYINYSRTVSFIRELTEYPNLVVLQTLSKAWGLAGIRLGMAFAGKPVIDYLNKVKYPYNISGSTQHLALEALDKINLVNLWTKTISDQQRRLSEELAALPITEKVYPSDANFILVKMKKAPEVFRYLASKGVVVRDRSQVKECPGCLRITIGTPEENKKLIEYLNAFNG